MRAQKGSLSVAVPVDERSLSIPDFCACEQISLATFYKLRRLGLGPKESRFLQCVRISPEARREWHENLQSAKAKRAAKIEYQRRMARIKLAIASPNHGSKVGKRQQSKSKNAAPA
jgi:hypothetical protein